MKIECEILSCTFDQFWFDAKICQYVRDVLKSIGYSNIIYMLSEDFHFIIISEIFRGRIIKVIQEFLLSDLKIFINGYPL